MPLYLELLRSANQYPNHFSNVNIPTMRKHSLPSLDLSAKPTFCDSNPLCSTDTIPKTQKEGTTVLPPISELVSSLGSAAPPGYQAAHSSNDLNNKESVTQLYHSYAWQQPKIASYSRSSSFSSASASSPVSLTNALVSPLPYPSANTFLPQTQSPFDGPQIFSSAQVQQQINPNDYHHVLPPQRAYSFTDVGGCSTLSPAIGEDEPQNQKKQIRRRTRTGCLTCRKRRIKCDERKPGCKNCEKSKVHCRGYQNKPTKNELKKLQKEQLIG